MWNFETMMSLFTDPKASQLLRQGTWGIERESQRVTPSGDLALTDHPAVFGDKLHNPRITTDFAESQLELITPPLNSIEESYDMLRQIHDEAEAGLGDELLWPLSMPPRLPSEDQIRIATFNDSPKGREKEEYRRDLAKRYGKKMQMISGLHVNFSFHEDMLEYLVEKWGSDADKRKLKDELYFALTRNFLRYRWLLIYLFGASPSIDPTYDSILCGELAVIEKCCPACCGQIGRYEQYAASLRVSRYGYSNTQRKPYMVSFNSLEEYVSSFRNLLRNVLKKESEFYSSIRLKPHREEGKSQLDALAEQGVNYIEVRIMDLDPYERVGISLQQLYVLHLFLLFCLFEQSPPVTQKEWKIINENHHMASLFGRKPNLKLQRYDKKKDTLKRWAEEILSKMGQIAKLMDLSDETLRYQDTVAEEVLKVNDPKHIPSARIQSEMTENNETFIEFGIRRAKQNRKMQLTGRS